MPGGHTLLPESDPSSRVSGQEHMDLVFNLENSHGKTQRHSQNDNGRVLLYTAVSARVDIPTRDPRVRESESRVCENANEGVGQRPEFLLYRLFGFSRWFTGPLPTQLATARTSTVTTRSKTWFGSGGKMR